jgi:hypothetical protein
LQRRTFAYFNLSVVNMRHHLGEVAHLEPLTAGGHFMIVFAYRHQPHLLNDAERFRKVTGLSPTTMLKRTAWFAASSKACKIGFLSEGLPSPIGCIGRSRQTAWLSFQR